MGPEGLKDTCHHKIEEKFCKRVYETKSVCETIDREMSLNRFATFVKSYNIKTFKSNEILQNWYQIAMPLSESRDFGMLCFSRSGNPGNSSSSEFESLVCFKNILKSRNHGGFQVLEICMKRIVSETIDLEHL